MGSDLRKTCEEAILSCFKRIYLDFPDGTEGNRKQTESMMANLTARFKAKTS
jgi:hypothetical protein